MLSVGPTEPWSLREKLCLASSVMRSGDQNWVSVSRAIKPFSEQGRPPDWFSQKHCASQYSELLENTEAPKRKRGEKGEVVETIEDVIVRRLTAERIEELKKLLRDTQDKYRKLKKEVDLIQTGHLDSRLEELWTDVSQKKKQDEDEADLKRKATDTAYQARQAVKNTPKRVHSVTVRSPLGASPTSMEAQTDTPTPPTDTAMSQAEETSGTTVAQEVAVFLPSSDAPMVLPKEGGLGSLIDDSPQKRLLSQKSTPPPSPLLSELLKKGSLISASPRLVVEGDVAAAGLANGGVPTATLAIPAGYEFSSSVFLSKPSSLSLPHCLSVFLSFYHTVCQCFSLNPALSLSLSLSPSLTRSVCQSFSLSHTLSVCQCFSLSLSHCLSVSVSL
uniref:Bromodomain containing 8b n=1 Tax=Hucho hucho TaxID=62062 RepID=A0A4W5JD62_9TELE